MSRPLQSFLAAILLMFGLIAGTEQSFAFEHMKAPTCAEASMRLGDLDDHSGCDDRMQHQSCASGGVCSFVFYKAASALPLRGERVVPFPAAHEDLIGSRLPPETPPPKVRI